MHPCWKVSRMWDKHAPREKDGAKKRKPGYRHAQGNLWYGKSLDMVEFRCSSVVVRNGPVSRTDRSQCTLPESADRLKSVYVRPKTELTRLDRFRIIPKPVQNFGWKERFKGFRFSRFYQFFSHLVVFRSTLIATKQPD